MKLSHKVRVLNADGTENKAGWITHHVMLNMRMGEKHWEEMDFELQNWKDMMCSSDMIGFNIIIRRSIGTLEEFTSQDVQRHVKRWNDFVKVIFQWTLRLKNI